MESRVLVVHPSEIVRQGLLSVIKEIADVQVTLLSSGEELNNFAGISGTKLLLLVDSTIQHKERYHTLIERFHLSNTFKMIRVRANGEQTDCEEGCDCCFFLNDNKSRIKYLLRPILKRDTDQSEQKNNTGLTDREIEVVKQVAFGKTNKEIADTLCISIHTVISHRKNITEKLGIKSISGLTVYAMLNNLIDAKTIDPGSLI